MPKESLYLSIINNLHDGVYVVDTQRRITFWNRAAEQITGYPAQEIVGKLCHESQLSYIDEEGHPLCMVGCPLFATLVDGEQRKHRVFVRHKQGYRIPVLVNVFPVYEDGVIVGATEIFTQDCPTVYEDNLVEHLSSIAMHDELTGLPNRRYLESYLSYRLDSYRRFGNLFCLLFSDIDGFREFNNTYGHDAGDAVLRNISASIQNNVRTDDLIGRWGGEELLAICSIPHARIAPLLAEKFRQLIAHTEVIYLAQPLHVTISVGATVVQPGDTAESIMARADRLMYHSRNSGKDKVTSG